MEHSPLLFCLTDFGPLHSPMASLHILFKPIKAMQLPCSFNSSLISETNPSEHPSPRLQLVALVCIGSVTYWVSRLYELTMLVIGRDVAVDGGGQAFRGAEALDGQRLHAEERGAC